MKTEINTQLFDPYDLGKIKLNNRMVMAPLTRCRAINQNLPNDLMVEYYAQRASAGLIISEGSSPSPNGLGYTNIPGLYNEAQVEGWAKVTNAVHEKGGKIFFQMMHTGRIAHPNNLPKGAEVIGASAIAQPGEITTYDLGKQPYPIPRELSTSEVQLTIKEFVDSAKLCINADFDGVEIHSAHGYLPNQFITAASNQRTDKYGGSIENRCRFLLEISEKMIAQIGANRVGVRISPFSYADETESSQTIKDTYIYLATEFEKQGIGYVHLSNMGEELADRTELWATIRKIYSGTLILCGSYDKEKAMHAIEEGKGDLIAFGRDYIGNPDLFERFKNDYPLAERKKNKWYGDGAIGYTDYPFYKK